MKSITIHKIDKEMYALLKAQAKKNDTSLNKTIKDLLRQALALQPRSLEEKRKDWKKFFKNHTPWTDKEVEEFNKATAWTRRIDKENWQ